MKKPDNAERVQKILSQAGFASRRAAEKLIEEGRVFVNGQKVSLGMKASLSDDIRVNGKKISLTFATKHVYFAFHKPRGYIVSEVQQGDDPIIFDLLPKRPRVFAVGRLDKESEGLLLLTNDGDFAQMIMHPKHEVKKIYNVLLDRPLATADRNAIEKGIDIVDEDHTKYSTQGTKILAQSGAKKFRVEIRMGKYHMIRKMFGHFGYAVSRLQRVAIGSVKLGNLASGKFRELTEEERNSLRA